MHVMFLTADLSNAFRCCLCKATVFYLNPRLSWELQLVSVAIYKIALKLYFTPAEKANLSFKSENTQYNLILY